MMCRVCDLESEMLENLVKCIRFEHRCFRIPEQDGAGRYNYQGPQFKQCWFARIQTSKAVPVGFRDLSRLRAPAADVETVVFLGLLDLPA